MRRVITTLLLVVGTISGVFHSISSQATQTLIVSDIDDTIKIAHVGDLWGVISHFDEPHSRFKGMSELYHTLVDDQLDAKMVYLTNAEWWLMSNHHKAFLRFGEFPEGQVFFRENESSDVHKLKVLRKLIVEEQPETVVMIGDNAERDPEFYQQISNEYADQGIEFLQYIRIAYNDQFTQRLQETQVGFVTPVEIAMDLVAKRVMSVFPARSLIGELSAGILNEKGPHEDYGPMFFPEWLRCDQHRLPEAPWFFEGLRVQESLTKVSRVCS